MRPLCLPSTIENGIERQNFGDKNFGDVEFR
jgi:hypothetical protein